MIEQKPSPLPSSTHQVQHPVADSPCPSSQDPAIHTAVVRAKFLRRIQASLCFQQSIKWRLNSPHGDPPRVRGVRFSPLGRGGRTQFEFRNWAKI